MNYLRLIGCLYGHVILERRRPFDRLGPVRCPRCWKVLAVLALALTLTPAAAANHQPDPKPLADQTARWLTGILGVEVRPQAIGSIDVDAQRPWIAASYEDRGERYILAEDWLVRDWARPHRADFHPEAGRILIHELLHGVSLDEGAVDAVAIDLLPAWSARFTPHIAVGAYTDDLWSASSYPSQVRSVRAASAQATGGRWRDRAARLWRRAWLLRGVG